MTASARILLGTTKGAFVLTPDGKGWSVSGPHCDGWCINHVIGDPDSGTLWAGGGGDWPGAGVWRCEDGKTWELSKLSNGQIDDWAAADPETAAFFKWEPAEVPFDDLKAVWSLHRAHGVLYAGTNPAALLSSKDGGRTWERNSALDNHPSRESWNPGAAGLVLHTMLSDPTDAGKFWLGISAAGVFATEDGGNSWERRNRLSNDTVCTEHRHPAAPRDGETGHCVHNMQRGPGDLLYQQNHHGTYRSTDGGRTWSDITAGLPSTFGFPVAIHPRNPDVIWVLPLNGDAAGRFPPDASAAVWKSTDGGETWAARRDGLPQGACFFTVLRQSMATDAAAGVYFGTNSGSVFASADEGESWTEIARHLPTILSVETLAL
ncbi:exo-alpha-sialidase [Leisingera sp. McT4-56]|uniref:exo-alpha-sialidase n=1 Tax=Leisingera sp. McT4-56 TaxID=2881255 RepID=UPI001CF8E5CE|nr:exo-alpha-sialidase [Leisingera sp. McT4-56]MCB4455147.1 exo-alpha-sialidase [Leisingera sp. McT4-56]